MNSRQRLVVTDLLTVGVLVATVVYTALVYHALPDPMPTHFDGRGIPNGWMPRAVGAWVGPGIGAAVVALLRFGHHLVAGEWRSRSALRPSPSSRSPAPD